MSCLLLAQESRQSNDFGVDRFLARWTALSSVYLAHLANGVSGTGSSRVTAGPEKVTGFVVVQEQERQRSLARRYVWRFVRPKAQYDIRSGVAIILWFCPG